MATGEGNLVPPTVQEDDSLPRFRLWDGRLVHLQTFGSSENPTAIMLHGGPGGDHRDYLQLESLSDQYFVILWDQRGTGLSERVPDEELDGPTYLKDLEYIVDTFSPDDDVFLIGHSWGGAYAAYYAQQHPEKIAGLALIEPGALNSENHKNASDSGISLLSQSVLEYLNTTDYLLPDIDSRADYFYVIALSSFKEDAPFLGYDFWRLGFRANIGINTWQGNFGSGSFDFTTGLSAIESKVLFVTGEPEERLGHVFQETYQAKHFNEVEFLQLPEVSHSDLLQDQRTTDKIRSYFEEVSQ